MIIKWDIIFQYCLLAGCRICIKKALYQPAFENGLLHDLWHIIRLDAHVIDSLRIYNHKSSLFAKAGTPRLLDADLSMQTPFLNLSFKGADDLSRAKAQTPGTGTDCHLFSPGVSLAFDFISQDLQILN